MEIDRYNRYVGRYITSFRSFEKVMKNSIIGNFCYEI